MDDNVHIQAARNGDLQAFNHLVLKYQDVAFSVAYRIVGDSETAADITQDAFIAAYRKLQQFRGKRFKSWLLRIVTNACYDELRRQQRRPVSSLDDLGDSVHSGGSSWHHTPDQPEEYAQRNELAEAIKDCIAALSGDQRIVAVLSDVEGFQYQEISEITGWPLGTVKSRLSRARKHLRDCLQAVRELLPAEYRLIGE